MALLYNLLIHAGKNIRVIECELFKPIGSSEQILQFWNISLEELKERNQ